MWFGSPARWRRSYEARRAWKQIWGFLAVAAVALALASSLTFYIQPEKWWDGLPDLARDVAKILLGGAVVALVCAVGWGFVFLVKNVRTSRRDRRDDRKTASPKSQAATGPAPSPNGSSDHATASTSARGKT
jgi:uncharacterized BrkB/YihY/UPF0761 family membrane protein